nr:hypothetical protein [uncultured Cellulosilyticum sp.]
MKKYIIKYGALFVLLCMLRLVVATLSGVPFIDSVSIITLVGLMAFAIILDIQNNKARKKK